MHKRKKFEGVVTSVKMNKTVVVTTSRTIRHPRYGKAIKINKKCYAHDEDNSCELGDRVIIFETRPLSKTKRWRVEKSI